MVTKQEIEREVEEFLLSFATCTDEAFGVSVADQLKRRVRDCPFWNGAMRMYEYAVGGLLPRDTGAMDSDDELMSVVRFLDGASDSGHGFYFGDFSLAIPKAAVNVAEMAHARHVLDGGQRQMIFDHEIDNEHLSIAEVALLANMDEKSVRNATGAKAADRLITETAGKRSVVPLEEARRWLAGRKEFVPTRRSHGSLPRPTGLSLPPDLAELLRSRAAAAKMDIESFLRERLVKEGT